MRDIWVMGLVKLGVLTVISFVVGFYQAAKKPPDSRWTTVVKEPPHKRALNWLRRRGSTTVEERQEPVWTKK